MSEYFFWANVDKKQFLSPPDFDCGCRLHESMHRETTPLTALYALLSSEWKGDRILFLGDEGSMSFPTNREVFRFLDSQVQQHATGGHYFDLAMDSYQNVSAQFKDAEAETRQEIEYYIEAVKNNCNDFEHVNEYGVNPDNPFEGLFLRTGRNFRYIINHTKKVYYSFYLTKILYADGTECPWADPLPILMAYGRTADLGPWVGDIIGVGNEIDETYTLLKEIFLDF